MAEVKNIGRTAEQVIALGGQFQAIMDMAQALKGMTSVEQAIEERKQALAKASSDHDAAEKNLKALQTQGTKLKADQQAASLAHDKALNDKNVEILEKAAKDAADIVGKARAEAENMTTTATAEAARIKTASDVANAAAQNRLRTATVAATGLEDKIASMQIEHDTFAKKMADLKSAAQKLAS